jgi:hypothetical protein
MTSDQFEKSNNQNWLQNQLVGLIRPKIWMVNIVTEVKKSVLTAISKIPNKLLVNVVVFIRNIF